MTPCDACGQSTHDQPKSEDTYRFCFACITKVYRKMKQELPPYFLDYNSFDLYFHASDWKKIGEEVIAQHPCPQCGESHG
jgi:hypothetical protein